MQTTRVGQVTIRPLRDGDRKTVSAVFERLGDQSRVQRFAGAKPRLSEADLELLSRVDGAHHVLVAWVDGDARPAGLARLVREGEVGEVAFEVADEHQRSGIGSALMQRLAGDARAAGITSLHATVRGENRGASKLLSRCARIVDVRWCGGEREVFATL
jgi:ribosomal protein S18 acetylase RimI-like enzyme